MARVSGAERRAVESRVVQRRWREIVAAWSRSDRNEQKFCKRQKIGVCALWWWVRRLAGDTDGGWSVRVTASRKPRVQHGRSRAEWARLCAAWERSGLRQAEFCRQLGLNVETLRWWRSQLHRLPTRDAPALLPAAADTLATPVAPPSFVPVVVTPTQAPAPVRRARGSTIEIVLRRSRRVRVGPDLDEHLLARVVAALEAIP
jgi:hypothetical protein